MGGHCNQLTDAMAATGISGGAKHEDQTLRTFFQHSSATRISTDAIIAEALTKQYPHLELAIVPAQSLALIAFAEAGFASIEPIEDNAGDLPASLQWERYVPPGRRIDGAIGNVVEQPHFARYLYKWQGHEFIIYFVDGRDGSQPYSFPNYYILTDYKGKAQQLVLEAGHWSAELHEEVWVYDSGYWQKSSSMYSSIHNASWAAVILDQDMKDAIVEDHLSFFRSRDTYAHLRVPWKRGLIYYGPPGNGKTISIKATMNMLSKLDPPVMPLYVRTLAHYAGPEYSIKTIFEQARRCAPCYLVFEDLDTLISPNVRSYFLNEVDGLKNNDGVFIVGSTNHLDRLDPGIAKRPSRFDRKYFFPDPNMEQRIAYCKFWQKKLADNEEIEFPDELCQAVAGITDKFSFAYIQEAFVAALLAIARRDKTSAPDSNSLTADLNDEWVDVLVEARVKKDLDKLVLWVELKKQIAILREGLEEEA
jgi:transitional endoplasmic reticulum ATPase